MLETEGVTELLKSLSAHADTHADIKGLSDSILRMLDEEQRFKSFMIDLMFWW